MKKIAKFDGIQVGQTIAFEDAGFIETGVVSTVTEKTFIVTALRSWDKNGVIAYYEKSFAFYKSTGNKTHSRYTHGSAMEITGNI